MTNLFTYLSNWKLKYLCALVVLLCLGVGTAWGAGAITVTSSAITLPKGSTSVSTGDWIDAAGVTKAGSSWAYSDWSGDQTIGSYGSITFDQAGDFNGADLLQFQKSGGNISTTISSPAGVDIVIGYKVGNNSFSVSLTGAAASVSGSSTSWSTMSISTTNTSATLTITKTNKGAGYVSYITITPKAAASCSVNPTIGAASLNGSFNLSTVGVQCASITPGSNCSVASGDYGFIWYANDGTKKEIGGTGVTKVAVTSGAYSSGSFSANLTSTFVLGNRYSVRAFATNGKPATAYSDTITFQPRSVTFNLNGHGSSTPTMQYVNNGGKATDPEYSESVVGWEFDKWYKEAECTNAWTFGTDVVSGANKTLYAKWTNTYANTVYTLVEDLYELDNNKKIIIMNTGHTEALSTTQQANNRTAVAYNASGNAGFAMSNSNKTATLASATSVQVITLKSTATTDVYQLNVENGYLRAAGSNESYLLKTYGSTPDSYCNFLFSLSSGNFSVVGQGDNDNKNIKYNSSSHLFSGYGDTQNAILIYVEQSSSVATPTFSPVTGTYGSTQSVSLSCGTAGATIYYTTDGSEPTRSSTAYSSAISVTTNTTIKAKAFKRGMHASETASATYNIRCATPSFSPVAGTYSSTQNVSLSCATAGATIYYTTDGSDPNESSSVYSSAISVSVNTTIKAIAVKSGMANSTIGSATFNIRCAQPTFSPAAGTKTGAQNITISAVTGATIYYTTDGSDPDENSSEYSSAIPISASTTIKAIAIKSGMANSEIASATYTIQYNITWMVNGVAWTPHDPDSDPDDGKVNGSSLVNYGTAWSALTLPSDPDYGDYCGQAFVGWTTDNIGATGLDKDVPADATRIAALNLMTNANKSGKSATITGNTTFYAVFADYGEDGD